MKKNDLKLEARSAIGIIFDVRQKLDEVSSIDDLIDVTDRLAYAVSILANALAQREEDCPEHVHAVDQEEA
jgi:hypothetical protein